MYFTVTSCTNGAIRLSGGRDQNEGRVEVCRNGLWGTVSRSGWDSDDAMVACRQLGLLQPRMLTSKLISQIGSVWSVWVRVGGRAHA